MELKQSKPLYTFHYTIHEKCRVFVPENDPDPRDDYYNVWYDGKVYQMPHATGKLYSYSMSHVASKFDLDQLVHLSMDINEAWR